MYFLSSFFHVSARLQAPLIRTFEMYTTGILFVPCVDSVPYFACNYSTLGFSLVFSSITISYFCVLPISFLTCVRLLSLRTGFVSPLQNKTFLPPNCTLSSFPLEANQRKQYNPHQCSYQGVDDPLKRFSPRGPG